ncbi:MAG: electron transfer flavoprotein subunit beta/FixA family protein [Lachnospiraceae bacterium]|jgi:electron transfer flavoprotein beta subunit|nr:electron transfer flavoprotein subunit beta/FixA family protein [Lachnospiraceae bacterium]
MNIIVCIKQVPSSSNVKVDPVTGVLIRDGVESKMNPYDLYALEMALTLKENHGGSVTVVTMGPDAAKAVLMEAIYMGADHGYLISDRRFAGADVLATSYTISSAISALGGYDLILCGKQTTDGDTAQVGAEMAEFLQLPHYANVHRAAYAANGRMVCSCELGATVLEAEIALPCLLCTDGEINTPRLPSYKRKCAAAGHDDLITTLCLNDFTDTDASHYGLTGSPTQVERIFPPEKNTERVFMEGSDASAQLFSLLKTRKFI